MENTEDLDKICNVLDKLTLDALTLMQEHIQLKINIENAMISGETHLAKARYIMGQNNVSSLQLPTENSIETSAPLKVISTDDTDNLRAKKFELVQAEKDDNEKLQDPLKWFGYLVPQNLNYAQQMYRQALQWVVQNATTQSRLASTLGTIDQLKKLKKSIVTKQ